METVDCSARHNGSEDRAWTAEGDTREVVGTPGVVLPDAAMRNLLHTTG